MCAVLRSGIVSSMEERERTSVIAEMLEPCKRRKKKSPPRAVRPMLGRLLLVFGLVLLAIYVAARIRGAVLSRVAVRQFEAQKQAAPETVPNTPNPPAATSTPNFLLWSQKRVEAYQDSLDRHLAAPIAVLRIPKISLEVPVLEGTDDLTLNRGVGRIEGTALVGENGNIGIAGHRDSFFRGLKDIKVGDRVELEGKESTETYVVDHLQIVDPNNVGVLQPGSKPSLTLVTCYPFYYIGSAPQRYIVHASRADFEPQKHNTHRTMQPDHGATVLAASRAEQTTNKPAEKMD